MSAPAAEVVTIDSTESEWFKIAALLVSVLGIVIFGWQIYIYSKIKSSPLGVIDPSDVNSMLIFNIIMLILSIILFGWALYRIFLHRTYRQKIQTGITTSVTGFLTGTEYGYIPATTPPPVIVPGEAAPKKAVVFPQQPVTSVTSVPSLKAVSRPVPLAQSSRPYGTVLAAQPAQPARPVPLAQPARTAPLAQPTASSSRSQFGAPVRPQQFTSQQFAAQPPAFSNAPPTSRKVPLLSNS